jgi:hypothetical protein
VPWENLNTFGEIRRDRGEQQGAPATPLSRLNECDAFQSILSETKLENYYLNVFDSGQGKSRIGKKEKVIKDNAKDIAGAIFK